MSILKSIFSSLIIWWKDFWGRVVPGFVDRGFAIASKAENWLLDSKKATYGSAVSRILLGLTGMGLVLNQLNTVFYTYGSGSAWTEQKTLPTSDFPVIFGFDIFRNIAFNDTAVILYMTALLLLSLLFILGYRTKIITPFYIVMHVGFIESQNIVHDQGDNMWRISMLILWFADSAGVWSLDSRRRRLALRQNRRMSLSQRLLTAQRIVPWWFRNLWHNLAVIALGAQVSFIYVSGALYKAGGKPWSAGHAIYGPLQVRQFSPWPEVVDVLMAWGPVAGIITYGTVIAQLSFPFMMLRRFTRILSLLVITSFHVGIAVLMGLPWFSLAMIAVDGLFVSDRTWRRFLAYLKGIWTKARSGGRGPLAPQERGATSGSAGVAPPRLPAVNKNTVTPEKEPEMQP